MGKVLRIDEDWQYGLKKKKKQKRMFRENYRGNYLVDNE